MEYLKRHAPKLSLRTKLPSADASCHVSSTSTDHILCQQQPYSPEHDASTSLQRSGSPADGDKLLSSALQASPSILPSPRVRGDVQLTGRATVSIAILDAKLPVSLWTSLNGWHFPWDMTATGEDSTGRLNFVCELDGIPEASFQYKVQMGDDNWVLDETKQIVRDKDGNENNIGYAERAAGPATSPARDDLQDTDDDCVLPDVAHVSHIRSENAQTGLTSTFNKDEVPLLRHESFQGDIEKHRPADASRKGSQSQFPLLSTIEEEAVTSSGDQTPESTPKMPSAHEQAREYQRALIEMMPDSIENGFTRASVLLPAANPNQARSAHLERIDELSQAPLMRHETSLGHGADIQEELADELDQGPLLRHETGFELVGTTQYEDTDELAQAPLMRHETGLGPAGNAQDEDLDELEHTPLLLHETGFEDIGEYQEGDLDEFDQSPLMQVETNATTPADDELDELNQAPLMRHETNMSDKAANAGDLPFDAQHSFLSYGSTLIGEDDNTPDEDGSLEWRLQTAVRHTVDSEANSEQLIFDLETSNPAIAHRSSSVYSNDYVSDESGRSDWDSEAINLRLYGRRGPHDRGENVSELDRAPTMSYETTDDVPSQVSDPDELENIPMLPHELGCSSEDNLLSGSDGPSLDRRYTDPTDADTASERSRARRIISGEKLVLSSKMTNSFNSEHLYEAFRDRIFGATHRPLFPHHDENGTGLGGAPLLAHERTFPVHKRSSSDSLNSRGGRFRRSSNEVPDFSTFTRRTISNIFRPHRSNLPHTMPHSDEEDLNLRDSSLEIFPMDRDGVFNRVLDIGSRLPEDVVPSTIHHDVGSPAVLSQACSSVDLVPIRSSSAMSLQSIREDASEDGDQHSQLPSPVLMLASRVPAIPRSSSSIPIPNTDEMKTPMPDEQRRGYLEVEERPTMPDETDGRDGMVVRRRIPSTKRPAIQYEEDEGLDDTDPSKRYGKVFATVALPPNPPQANVPLPPRASTVSSMNPSETDNSGKIKKRRLTPYPQRNNDAEGKDPHGGNIALRICRHLRSCFPSRPTSIFIVGIVAAGAAFWWKRWA